MMHVLTIPGDCFTRALALIPGCQPFMNIINENQGQISKSTVHELLELAKDNKTEVYVNA